VIVTALSVTLQSRSPMLNIYLLMTRAAMLRLLYETEDCSILINSY